MKIRLGSKHNISSLNIRGVKKPGVRDEVEQWMKKRQIAILGLQETRHNQNSKETRKQYTWFFSEEGARKEYTAGVGIVISNKYLKYIKDVEPITDRIMYVTLNAAVEINIVVVYMPTADRPQVEKQKAYEDLVTVITDKQSKGPIYIMGDFNARLIFPTTQEEAMGKHTMHTNGSKIELLAESMRENRDLMMELCMTYKLKATNTTYRKPLTKIATYRKIEEVRIDEIEQITPQHT